MPKVGMEPIRRAQVIRAVIECIAEQGLEVLTIDAVAGRAGVSKGVVNHYFAGKRDLILQSFQAFLESYNQKVVDSFRPEMRAMDMMDIVIDVCLYDVEGGRPPWKEDTKTAVKEPAEGRASPDHSKEQLGRVFVHFLSKTILDRDFQEVYLKVYSTYMAGMITIIEQGIAAGEFRDLDPETAAYGLMALIDGTVMYRNIGFHPLSAQGARRMCRDFARQYLLQR